MKFDMKLNPHETPKSVKIFRISFIFVLVLYITILMPMNASAATDIFAKAKELIVDIYQKIVGISTALAGLMSAVAVIGVKMSNNQHKVDQAWDWLKRIWIAWAIINGIGAFIAYVSPLFQGLATLS